VRPSLVFLIFIFIIIIIIIFHVVNLVVVSMEKNSVCLVFILTVPPKAASNLTEIRYATSAPLLISIWSPQ
jgi:hypothetical protein